MTMSLGQLAEYIRVGYVARFSASCPSLRMPREARELTASVWADLARDTETEVAADRLLDSAFVDAFVRETGFLPRAILGARVRLLAHGPRRPRSTSATSPAPAREYVEDLGDFAADIEGPL